MVSLIAIDDYNKAKEYRKKYYKSKNSKIDILSKKHKENAMKHYHIAANAGNVDAMYELAIIYSHHQSFGYNDFTFEYFKYDYAKESTKQALDWLKRAADLEHIDALNILCGYYSSSYYGAYNIIKAYPYLMKHYQLTGNLNRIEYLFRYYHETSQYQEGVNFIERVVKDHNIDLKNWQYTTSLASLYNELNHKEEVERLYRIVAKTDNLSQYFRENYKAYLFVADEYYANKDYENALKYYKITNINKVKEMAKKNEGINPQQYFEYLNSSFNKLELAKCHLEGFGTEKNEVIAFEILKKEYDRIKSNVVTLANAPCELLVLLADRYYYGRGTKSNINEALQLFLLAEKKNDYKNYDRDFAIAWCMYHTKDYKNAVPRLNKIIEKYKDKCDWAYHLLGNCYYYGLGCNKSLTKAYTLYSKGAEFNHHSCLNQKAICLLNGEGITKDTTNLYALFSKAYELSQHPIYASNIGLCYENGYGCEQDYELAYEWYSKAAKEKNAIAIKKVEELKPLVDKQKREKNAKEQQKKVEELTKEIIEKIKELKENNKNTVSVKTDVVEGSTKAALHELIGLSSVKKEIQELENFIKVMNMRRAKGLPVTDISKHMVFTGNPGTGKTTVARIVAQIYKENGILKTGQLVETDRDGLVGQYIGETGKKTRKVIESAMGGVLFIDEAYSLIPKDSDKDFGPEAVATLLKMMEDYKNDFVVIVAGYEDEMNHFIDSNPGLKSRFTSYVNFPDYTPDEMHQIFTLKASKDLFEISQGAKEKLYHLWEESYKYRNLGNGRCVRNVYEKVQRLQSNRIIEQNLTSDEDFMLILEDDIPQVEEIFR